VSGAPWRRLIWAYAMVILGRDLPPAPDPRVTYHRLPEDGDPFSARNCEEIAKYSRSR